MDSAPGHGWFFKLQVDAHIPVPRTGGDLRKLSKTQCLAGVVSGARMERQMLS
jgi:hypothetical protein